MKLLYHKNPANTTVFCLAPAADTKKLFDFHQKAKIKI